MKSQLASGSEGIRADINGLTDLPLVCNHDVPGPLHLTVGYAGVIFPEWVE